MSPHCVWGLSCRQMWTPTDIHTKASLLQNVPRNPLGLGRQHPTASLALLSGTVLKDCTPSPAVRGAIYSCSPIYSHFLTGSSEACPSKETKAVTGDILLYFPIPSHRKFGAGTQTYICRHTHARSLSQGSPPPQTPIHPAVPHSGNASYRESLWFFNIESCCPDRLFICFLGSSQALQSLPPLLPPFLQVLLESQPLSRQLPALGTGARTFVSISTADF